MKWSERLECEGGGICLNEFLTEKQRLLNTNALAMKQINDNIGVYNKTKGVKRNECL